MLIPFAPTEAHSFCARCGFFFFFLLWTAGSGGGGGGVGVFRSVVGKWACVCVCGSELVLVVGFFFCCGLPVVVVVVVVVVVPVVDGTGG